MSFAQTLSLARPIPSGIPSADDFSVSTAETILNSTDIPEGSVLVKLTALSADPYMRSGVKTGKAGDVIRGFVTGTIVESNGNSSWSVGDTFGAHLPFTSIQVVDPAKTAFGMWPLKNFLTEQNIQLGLGLFGMPGSTAYGGLIDILQPLQGETIFISAASGAVGSLVGLLAKKMYNCRVIGSAGGPEKCKVLLDLGYFDAALDYKQHSTADSLTESLKKAAPDGIDMYFENVGGIHFDAAFRSLRTKGRIAICGCIRCVVEGEKRKGVGTTNKSNSYPITSSPYHIAASTTRARTSPVATPLTSLP